MASTFLDKKISSFIEDKFPEFVRTDHPIFVDFLRLYYQFLETAKISLTNVQAQDNILLENLLTDNFLLLEDGEKLYTEDSQYGAFVKGENVVGQTSGAVSNILAEDNVNAFLYIEHNRNFQVGEVVVGSSTGARGTIFKYQGNPIQNIQQLIEYANVDKTLTDFLDRFRDAYLNTIPNTLASGVSKRNLVKNVRELYRAKGTKQGHELFFRLLFAETPEIFYPKDQILKISAGEWTSDTVIRILATQGNPVNLTGQSITQTENTGIGAFEATATIESVLQIQEGENTVFQLILNPDSITGTFISGAEVTGVDNTDIDTAITGTIQKIVTGAAVTEGASFYNTSDTVSIVSDTGQEAKIDIVDVGSGSVDQIVIDNPGSGYSVGTDLYFDNTNTEGSGASAKITNVGGAVAVEAGDAAEYGTISTDHIVYEDATEASDAYTGNQIQLETQTFTDLGVGTETGEGVNITTFSGGSGYEIAPTVVPTSARIYWSISALTTTGTFIIGENITNQTSLTAKVAVLRSGNMSIANASGTFNVGDVITGGTSGAKATLTIVNTHGTGATFLTWSPSGLGSVKGVEVKKFGTGFVNAPTLNLPVKVLITRNTNVSGTPPNVSSASSFSVGDTVRGQTSNAIGTVTAWDNTRQLLTVKMSSLNFTLGEVLRRGDTTNYAIINQLSQASLSSTIGTLGTTAGSFSGDKGKISESLMRVQDSFYYQDFSYVVRVGSAISDWRGSVKRAIHPAGFALFGEVSLVSRVAAKLTTPVTGITSETPTLASLFEATLFTIVGRRLGTQSDGTTLQTNANLGHKIGLISTISAISATSNTVTVITDTPHGIEAGELVQISGVETSGYDGVHTVATIINDARFTYTLSSTPTSPGVLGPSPKVLLASPFKSTTRDLTLRTHYEIPVTIKILSGFDQLRQNRYGLGATKKTASRYLWSVGGNTDTSPVSLDKESFIYPNIRRRQRPHTAEDNVNAGNAGVYNSTFNYTNIQIGVHEQNVHMTIEQFGDVPLNHIIRSARFLVDEETGDDTSSILLEDGNYSVFEDDTEQTIPQEANKLWNVPPPSYIRGVSSTGEYIYFDDNTSPPDMSDNTAPPSFDQTV